MTSYRGYARQMAPRNLTDRSIDKHSARPQRLQRITWAATALARACCGNRLGQRLIRCPRRTCSSLPPALLWHRDAHVCPFRSDRQIAADRHLWRRQRRRLLWPRTQIRRVGRRRLYRAVAESPVYLAIADDQVELRDADDLWGLDHLPDRGRHPPRLGRREVKTATIGPAGENLVRFAGIQVTPQRSAARCGLGAVMGSKHLKAIAVRGHSRVRVADPDRFHDLTD